MNDLNDLDAVRWLLEHRPPPQPLLDQLVALKLPRVDVGDRRVHVFNGCKTAAAAHPTASAVAAAPASLPRTTLGEVLETDPELLCAMCLHMWLEYGMRNSPEDAPLLVNLIRVLPRLGRALERLQTSTMQGDLAFEQVPWDHLGYMLPWSIHAEGKQPRERMQDDLVAAQRRMIDWVAEREPQWLYVRYAAESVLAEDPEGRSPLNAGDAVMQRLIRGSAPFPTGREPGPRVDASLDALLEHTAEVVGSEPRVPVAVDSRRGSRVALSSRHLITPVLEVGAVQVLAVPRCWAAAVDSDRVIHGWLDLAEGWQHDETATQRLRTAVTLWEGRPDGSYSTLEEGWSAAQRLHP